jgi:hemolysin III
VCVEEVCTVSSEFAGRPLARVSHPAIGRAYSLGEEIANSITHGVGLVASLAGAALLVLLVAPHGDPLWLAADSVYAATLIVLYTASTLYHALPRRRAKRVFRVLDHAAIYLLIAGTYTPFALLNLRGAWGWDLCAAVWILAGLGVTFTALIRHRLSRATTMIYVAMGWAGVLVAKPAFHHVPAWGLVWLLAGGLLYTAGTLFYAWERLRYGHAIWHVFVLAGSMCHYVAVLRYAGPR